MLEERETEIRTERKVRADVGDELEIIVTGSEPDRLGSNPRLICEIADPNFEGYCHCHLYYKSKD